MENNHNYDKNRNNKKHYYYKNNSNNYSSNGTVSFDKKQNNYKKQYYQNNWYQKRKNEKEKKRYSDGDINNIVEKKFADDSKEVDNAFTINNYIKEEPKKIENNNGNELFRDVLEEEKKDNREMMAKLKKIGFTILGIFLLIGFVTSLTFLIFSLFNKDISHGDIVTGEIYVKVLEDKTPLSFSLKDLKPTTIASARMDNDNYLDFTVASRNNSVSNAVLYKIILENGNDENGLIRVSDENVLFDLAVIDETYNETILISAATQEEFNNTDLDYFNHVLQGTFDEKKINYRLRMWVKENSIPSSQIDKYFANVKISILTEMTNKSLPITIETERVNSKTLLKTNLSNNYDLMDEDKDLLNIDTMRYQITNSDGTLFFSYFDSVNNVEVNNQTSFDLTYSFSKNERKEENITLISQDGSNVLAPITIKVYKNNRLIKEYSELVFVSGDNYCLNNGFNKLIDCLFVNENDYSSVSYAKDVISKKDINSNQNGLFEVQDNFGTSYIYRGDVDNNNVLFAGLKWKIIRINGDNSFRLIYDDILDDLSNVAFNYQSNGPTYVGYMINEEEVAWESDTFSKNDIKKDEVFTWANSYEMNILDNGKVSYTLKGEVISSTINDINDYTKTPYICLNSESSCDELYKVISIDESTINVKTLTLSPNSSDEKVIYTNVKNSNAKEKLEYWYKNSFMDLVNNNKKASSYVVDGVWYNNRSIVRKDTNTIIYTDKNYVPSLKYSNTNDTFSYSTKNGNGKMMYPVGLITLDEALLAGATFDRANQNYYLYNGKDYWTMTPMSYLNSSKVGIITSMGTISEAKVNEQINLRPVINISKDVTIIGGNGRETNPFIIE